MNNFAQARGLHDSGGTATQRRAQRYDILSMSPAYAALMPNESNAANDPFSLDLGLSFPDLTS
jgi:hypothetical protein